MQVNDNNDGQTITLPDGTRVQVDAQRLATDWQYNVEIGSAILNNDLNAEQSYPQSLGVGGPGALALVLQTVLWDSLAWHHHVAN